MNVFDDFVEGVVVFDVVLGVVDCIMCWSEVVEVVGVECFEDFV